MAAQSCPQDGSGGISSRQLGPLVRRFPCISFASDSATVRTYSGACSNIVYLSPQIRTQAGCAPKSLLRSEDQVKSSPLLEGLAETWSPGPDEHALLPSKRVTQLQSARKPLPVLGPIRLSLPHCAFLRASDLLRKRLKNTDCYAVVERKHGTTRLIALIARGSGSAWYLDSHSISRMESTGGDREAPLSPSTDQLSRRLLYLLNQLKSHHPNLYAYQRAKLRRPPGPPTLTRTSSSPSRVPLG